jgi:hypothetical protein
MRAFISAIYRVLNCQKLLGGAMSNIVELNILMSF